MGCYVCQNVSWDVDGWSSCKTFSFLILNHMKKGHFKSTIVSFKIVALIGGIVNIFAGSLMLSGLLGFLFWTTAFISGKSFMILIKCMDSFSNLNLLSLKLNQKVVKDC
jgi:hypothetical protein